MRFHSTKFLYVALCAVLAVAALFVNLRKTEPVTLAKALAEFPSSIHSWTMTKEEILDKATLAMIRPTEYLMRQYSGPKGEKVWLYVVYYDGSDGKVGIHPPLLCFSGNGWAEKSRHVGEIDIDGVDVKYRDVVYDKDGKKEYVLYWYQVYRDAIPDEYLLKLYVAKNSMLHGRRDQALVRINVDFTSDVDQARATAIMFLKSVCPYIHDYLSS